MIRMQEIHLPGRYSRSVELYEHLRHAIVDGALPAGDRLVEEQIAAMASVSRTPVREALRRLEADGLVQVTPRGATVAAATLDEMIEFCVVREVLEGMATRLAAISRSELELATMRQLLREYDEASAVADVPRLVLLNNTFHESIWQAARNRYLMQQLSFLRTMVQRMQTTTLALPQRRLDALAEHREMMEAIAAGDGDRAEELAKLHVRRAVSIRMAGLKTT